MFDNIKKNFGFGMMRLPMINNEVDYNETCKMIDTFISNGFNYFDTAHGYIDGKSELAIRDCLVKRYKREDYVLVNKLTNNFFQKNEDIIPFFNTQLEACGVDYFDIYLMHAQNAEYFEKYKKCKAYETAFELKKKGLVKHVGISFHDKAVVLDQILTEYPEIECVQIQFNYVDYLDPSIEGKLCYEVCVKHNKPVIVMEPVKGGSLIKLPNIAQKIFDDLNGGSNASYAIRFAASFDKVKMVLSGMSNMEQMNDNISFMKEFIPLNDNEMTAINKVCDIFKTQDIIPCTACEYCVDGCPKQIPIPQIFACYNANKAYNDWNSDWYYNIHTEAKGKAKDCIKCGKCQNICPQHLSIIKLLEESAKIFDK